MHTRFIPSISSATKLPVGLSMMAQVADLKCSHWHPVTSEVQGASYAPGDKSPRTAQLSVKSVTDNEVTRVCEVKTPLALILTQPEVAWCKAATHMEALICEAEVSLAWQTPSSYRRWFSCWRGRGVRVNDLLNMTWIWRVRASY